MMQVEKVTRIQTVLPIDLPIKARLKNVSPAIFSPTISVSQKASHFTLPHPSTLKEKTSKPMQIILANVLLRLEEFKKVFQAFLDREIDLISESNQINLEKSAELSMESEKVLEKSDYWSFLVSVGAYLVGAASIVIGASIITAGAPALTIATGITMILSGGTSILGSILNELNTHPQLATALVIGGSALGVVSGISSAYFGLTAIGGHIGKIITASISVVTSSAEIMKDKYQWDLSDLKAAHTLLKKGQEVDLTRLKNTSSDLSTLETTTNSSTLALVEAQRRLEESCKRITEIAG